ncbi:hypothetical protein T01_1559 [Trichinella spiralis]|uniref:Uncharacterized protein n=1 Tax=Trichinella spiralis TaxID=6334 RepID=A0A0V1BKG9_TRISP|nr:hypothetical protein T01_1559 [Trichinella spiralis]
MDGWMDHFGVLITGAQSSFPRITRILTPIKSGFRPPSTKTWLCSCKLCPSPGIQATVSLPLVSRTSTHFRFAEFGFFGFLINTFKTTPLICG